MREIADLFVAGTAVPWSTPRTVRTGAVGGKRGHRHIKAGHLIAWQDSIRAVYTLGGVYPPTYRGPVLLRLTFYRGTADASLWETPWWGEKPSRANPDLTNLVKSTEDAIRTYRRYHGIGVDRRLVFEVPGLIAEDSQVAELVARKLHGEWDGARIVIHAIE